MPDLQEVQGMLRPIAACLVFVDLWEILEKSTAQAKAGLLCEKATERGSYLLGQVESQAITRVGWMVLAVSDIQGSSHKTVNWFLNRNFTDQKGLEQNIQSDEKRDITTKITLPTKAII